MLTNTLLSITITGDAEGFTTVDFANGDPLPPLGLSIDSGQLNILANSSSSTLVATSTAAVFGNAAIAEADLYYPDTTALSFLNANSSDNIDLVNGTANFGGDPNATTAKLQLN